MTYNLSGTGNFTTPDQFIITMNDMSGGLIGIFLLIGVFILSFKLMSRGQVSDVKASILSFFVTEFFSILFWILGILSWEYSAIPLILLFFSGVYFGFRDR